MSPSPHNPPAEEAPRAAPGHAGELVTAFVWLCCALRVGLAAVAGGTSGADLTLAALAIVVLPLLARDGVIWILRPLTSAVTRRVNAARASGSRRTGAVLRKVL